MINIDSIFELLIFTQKQDTYSNLKDIRSITVNAILKQIENLNIAVILSKRLDNIEFLKAEISESIDEDSISEIVYNFEGFIKDAFFIRCFLIIENHINQIAEFYEKSEGDIKHKTSIFSTFMNLIKKEKCKLFSDTSNYDIELFKFYCFSRNTIHKIGVQPKPNKLLIIHDKNSVINKNEIKLELVFGKENNLNSNYLLLLHEQIIKLILKINSKIPKEDYIEHISANSYN